MVLLFLKSQEATELTVAFTLLLTIVLALVITARYMKKRTSSLLYWGLGIWVFAIGVLLELAFAVGIYSGLLIKLYLILVAILVELLALGSIQLIKSVKLKRFYYVFVVISTLLLIYFTAVTDMGNLIQYYVVWNPPPLSVILLSSLITFPAAIVIAGIALKGFLQRRSYKLLSIIIGVIEVSIAGTLYIVAYPAFLYIAEVLGILLLWYGFI
ncbi:MAG: hypothetical protein KGH67_03010 [Candidatus Micrarchaeota archaeon]|nr:hypothetical protein [Candidatus Micrarchaeota archaeon]MDE1859473.1 hypothetical protein [Candidatus Micrarchaeota archaeon]